MKLSLTVLILAASIYAEADTISRTNAGNACQTVSGTINLSADDGIILSTGKTGYQINQAPEALEQMSLINLTEGFQGTFKICPTGARDRFGNDIVNILRYSNITLKKSK